MLPLSSDPGRCRDVRVFPEGSADLHAHTTASDGRLEPLRLVLYAREKGLRAVGICDHDTVDGIRSLYPVGTGPDVLKPLVIHGVEVVPGVEMNCLWQGHEVHILGYYIPLSDGPLADLLTAMRSDRVERARQAVNVLKGLGMPVDFDRVMELSGGGSVGRPHIARAMVEKGYVSSVKDAFRRYLGIGMPAYIDRKHLAPLDAVRAITSARGVPVWAHPGTSSSLYLLPELVSNGLRGLEVYHPDHGPDMVKTCLKLAEEYGLLVTGGSDFHGRDMDEGGDLGSSVAPYSAVLSIKGLALSKG